MRVSDFLSAPNLHSLLWAVFASDVGLASQAAPRTQYAAVVEAFSQCKINLAVFRADKNHVLVASGMTDTQTKVPVSHREETQLFIDVYSGLHALQSVTADEHVMLRNVVYPAIRKMFERNPVLWESTCTLIDECLQVITPEAGARMREALATKWRLPVVAAEAELTPS